MIYVCNLFEMPGHVEALGASHLISLVPAEEQPPTPAGLDPDRHLRIEIHDISEPVEGCVPCEDTPHPHLAGVRERLGRRAAAGGALRRRH